MNNKKEILSYAALIQQLKTFCREKRSGTMLIISTDRHSVRFVLDNGLIIACAYTMTQGKEALPMIKSIQSGSFNFVDGGFTGGMNINESPLPDTPLIFNFLEGGGKPMQSREAKPAPSMQDFSKVIEEIEKELSEYVGPMAEFICEEYIEDMGAPSNNAGLKSMINTVSSEIDDQMEKATFTKKAMEAIA